MRSHKFDSVAVPQVMQHLIRRECARADRNGENFSLVTFHVEGQGRHRTLAGHRLSRAMLKRGRLSDDIGWLDDEHLAALLPDTTPEGATAFADGVATMIARHGPRPLATLYAYPRDGAAIKSAPQLNPSLPSLDEKNPITLAAKTGDMDVKQAPAKSRHETTRQEPVKHPLPVTGIEELLAYPTPFWKRGIDVVGAAVLLVLLAPVLLIAAIAIKLSSPGPAIFKQRRSGLGGKPFMIYKLRTMIVNAEKQQQELRKFNEQDGPAFKLTHDPRVTRVGHILRKTSIDELPQLWNVLRGEMSLVGPRPLPTKEQEGCMQWQRHRLNVAPGLTCIWQVKGRSVVSFADWVRMDVEYMRNRTMFHDLAILFSTVPSVLLRRGAR